VIGIVAVSHSARLAEAALELALQMVPGERPAIALAAGSNGELGTDATRVAKAIAEVASPDGVLVLVDLGSAVISAELSLEFLEPHDYEVRITSAPFVEGLLAGVVRAATGASLDEVEREACGALESKRGVLGDDAPPRSVAAPPAGAPSGLAADFTLHNPSGLHIRPASMLVMALAGLDATVTVANLRTASDSRPANSPTSLLTLGVLDGDTVRVTASGREAAGALEVVRAMVASGFGELQEAAVASTAVPGTLDEAPRRGPIGVSPGRAVGPVVRMPEPLDAPVASPTLPQRGRAAEADRIDRATATVGAALRARAERVSGEARDILAAAALMATDPAVVDDARAMVLDRGDSAEFAVWATVGSIAETFLEQGGRFAERTADLHDMRNRVVAELLGRPEPGVPVRSEPFVLVARDLAPADTALLDPAICRAIVTVEGGPTSHTAILSRSLGLPAIVSVTDAMEIPEGSILLVDGTAGTLTIDPSADEIAAVEASSAAPAHFTGSGQTSDGHRVLLLANIGSADSVQAALDAGAEGVGLFRTEFLFLDRAQAPSVDEQAATYTRVLRAFAGRRVIVRTLDAGADKPLAFVTLAQEGNPALGVRGYRTSWLRPELIEDQLEAIARAVADSAAEVQVMAPMIDTPDEAADFARRCAAHGLTSVGVMIETPAAAITAPELFAVVDFVSLGTNDLAQYTMAADREVGELALLNDPWQPAVLRMMRLAFDAGAAAGKPVSVCGEAAADPLLAAVLVGMGASSLSMSPRALGYVGELLGGVTLADCRAAAIAAAGARSASAARAAASAALLPA
jgi:phosphoenolpyruvate-protein phosphotransferase